MKTIRLTRRPVLMALALASVLSAFSISPVLADNDGGHKKNARHHERDRGDWGRDHRDYRPVYRHPYGYAQPVYVPPPVYYEPRQSPGISLFLPLDLRR